ncbi:MAG: M15 family metallopeptidase [Candidatus Gracilibacteria bacterium]|nr:M15 family metallopeptidase [Candidatus Gracilibacteria bacterium]MDQ7022712.1 M15 family metallopeptidase [Candidatus Gracilibacteria bacterium]
MNKKEVQKEVKKDYKENNGYFKNISKKQLIFFIILYIIIFIIGFGAGFIIKSNMEYKKIEQEKIRKEQISKKKIDKINEEKKKIEDEKIKKEEEYLNYIKNVDLKTDSSLTKYVNNKIHYNKLGFVPTDLVPVEGKYIIDGKGGSIKVQKILKESLDNLAVDFFEATDNNIVVVSGYRGYKYQKGIKDRGCSDIFCAKAGYSEHQSGLAIDIYSASSKRNWVNDNNLREYYIWFDKNAYKYGFTNTYKKGIEIDGYGEEPWHWRYVGTKLANYLQENKITFAEFYNKKIEKNK